MSAAWVSSSVRLPDFIRTTTFRWTLAIASALSVFAANTPEQRLAEIDDRLRKDPRHVKVAGLFGADGHRIAGNIESLPGGLAPDVPTGVVVVRIDGGERERQKVRLAMHPLPTGEILVIGRNIDEIAEIAEIVWRALGLGLLPAFAVAVAIGMMLSLRALSRLSDVNRRIQRIVAGDLRERLPARGSDDPFDQLAVSVNRMLGEIETLIHEIAGVGDDIAHDLRTPLTRVRVRLERGREHAATLG